MGKSFRRMKRKIRCRLRYGKECPHGSGHCRQRAVKVTAPTGRAAKANPTTIASGARHSRVNATKP